MASGRTSSVGRHGHRRARPLFNLVPGASCTRGRPGACVSNTDGDGRPDKAPSSPTGGADRHRAAARRHRHGKSTSSDLEDRDGDGKADHREVLVPGSPTNPNNTPLSLTTGSTSRTKGQLKPSSTRHVRHLLEGAMTAAIFGSSSRESRRRSVRSGLTSHLRRLRGSRMDAFDA
jgi:hypothetical protein